MAEHLVRLGGRWSVWRWACLRATGFPARLVGELAAPRLGDVADRCLAQEPNVARRREALIAACRAAEDRLGPAGRPIVQRALRRVWQHKLPEPIADAILEDARRALADELTRHAAIEAELRDEYARARQAGSAALRRIAGDDRFRQALLWQNPSAVVQGVEWLARRPLDASDSETRKKERVLTSYVQRYTVKNDTIGFFGPVGWATLADAPGTVVQRPGRALVARSTVYYEYWACDALATRIAEDPALRPYLAPRLLPRFRIDGTTLHIPVGRTSELPAEFAALAARCDGERTARELAAEIVGLAELAIDDEAEVYDLLDELAASGVITWTLELPTAGAHPEHRLAALLARIDDPALRAAAQAPFDELERHRARVAASQTAAELAPALAGFDDAFRAITAVDSRRAHGQMYAGRMPLYADGRRDLEVEVGRGVLDRLAAPLELLLASARWFTHEIATRYRRALDAAYRALRAGAADPALDYARFWTAVPALFPGASAAGSIVGEVRDELQRRWAAVLAVEPDVRAVHRRAAALAPEVERVFAAPRPGWPAARHHSPDVMIAAAGPDALARGELQIVLGEMHVGFNTVAEPVFVKEHPAPDELVAARQADVDRVCIAPVWSKAVTRSDYFSLTPRDLDLEHADTRSARPRDHVLTTGALVVGDFGQGLEVRSRDARWRFDIIAFLEHHLIAESHAAFAPIGPAPFTPRIAIDDVVIARATWRIAPAELAWLALKAPEARFVAARRWARASGLPRWVFVKTAQEVKPVYVDLDSPLFVELLAKLLRDATAATISEMTPTADEAWIVDGDGERYTGELRIAAVDPEPWQPEPPAPAA